MNIHSVYAFLLYISKLQCDCLCKCCVEAHLKNIHKNKPINGLREKMIIFPKKEAKFVPIHQFFIFAASAATFRFAPKEAVHVTNNTGDALSSYHIVSVFIIAKKHVTFLYYYLSLEITILHLV